MFLMIEKNVLYDDQLSSDEKIVLMIMKDRLSLSRTKGQQFKKGQRYFLRYSQQEMAQVIHRSARTVFAIYKHLEQLGYIVREKLRYASDNLFLPWAVIFAKTNSQNLRTSNTKSSKNTNDTNHTSTQTQPKLKNNPTSLSTQIAIWKTAVTGKARLDNAAVDTIIRYCRHNQTYDLAKCKAIIGTIFKAKRQVIRTSKLKANDPLTRFENNTKMKGLAIALQRIFTKSIQAQNEFGYIYKSLQTFFLDAMGLRHERQISPTVNVAATPGKINIKKPARMKEEYHPKPVNKAIQQKFKAQLAALKKIKPNWE